MPTQYIVVETAKGNRFALKTLDGRIVTSLDPTSTEGSKVKEVHDCKGRGITVQDVANQCQGAGSMSMLFNKVKDFKESNKDAKSELATHLTAKVGLEKIATKLEIQVCTLGGDVQKLQLAPAAIWKDLQELVAQQFGIPPALQVFARDAELLRVWSDVPLQELGISSDVVLTVTRVSRAWFWADALGANPCIDAWKGIESGKFDYLGLSNLFAWVDDQNGEDSASEDLGAGVIYMPAGELPVTSADMLDFLSGSNGEHLPVIPFLTGEEGEEVDMRLCPWIDISELKLGKIDEMWPPEEKRPYSHYMRRYDEIMHAPSLVEATRSLVCVGEDVSEKDLEIIAAQCTFFACMGHHVSLGALKHESELAGFFKQDCPSPFVIICANHVKRTIAFAYQISYYV